jgi:hypothetical protein
MAVTVMDITIMSNISNCLLLSNFVAGCWMLDAGCWLLVAGCWMLDAGCRLLVAGCWLPVAGFGFPVRSALLLAL